MKTVSVDVISNIKELPEEICYEILNAPKLQTSGFQEILCYRGREVVASLGGYWRNQEDKEFVATSFGSRNYQWNGYRLERKRAASLTVHAKDNSDLSTFARDLQYALDNFKFISGDNLAFLPNYVKHGEKKATFPLPDMFSVEIPKLKEHIEKCLGEKLSTVNVQITF